MRKILLFLLLLTPGLWADDLKGQPDKSAPAGWRRYSFGSGPGLSIDLPGQPKQQKMGGAPGVKSINVYLATGNQVVGLVESFEFSTSAESKGFRENFFPAAFSSFKSNFESSSHLKLQVLGRKAAQIGKLTGFEENYSNPKMLGRVRLVVLDKRGFLISLFVPASSPKLMDQFVQSAKLLP